MKLTVSKSLFNPIRLPGMGRSIEVPDLSESDALQARKAFSEGQLFVEFAEEPGSELKVIQMWANPHSSQLTLFV